MRINKLTDYDLLESLGMMNFDLSEKLTKQLCVKMNEKKYKKYITDSNDKFLGQLWFYRKMKTSSIESRDEEST